jgi:prevent-host-death family protein
MEQIPISEFKALCLRLLAEVKRTGEPITVTRNGEPLVVVYPAPTERKRVPFGVAKGTGEIHGDLVEPVEPPSVWEVFQ